MSYVIKRNGSRESFDIQKIKKVISWACNGLNVNPLELEAKIDVLPEDITTAEVHDLIIHLAATLVSVEESEWTLVAGRLFMMKAHKERNTYGNDFVSYVREMINNGKYTHYLRAYSDEELQEMAEVLDINRDFKYDYAGLKALFRGYLLPEELPQYAYMVIALLLAKPEKKSSRIRYAKMFYEVISNLEVSLASPILSNLRKPNGNLSSCFILGTDDDLDSIFDRVHDVAKISKNGGGVGVNLSGVRGTGSAIQGIKGASKGVIPWIKIFNETAVSVDQLGKRSGAVTIGLDSWHLDTERFLELQLENGDQRFRAYDVFPQIIASDLFMETVEVDGDWVLFDPHEVKALMGEDLSKKYGDDFRRLYYKCLGMNTLGLFELSKTVKAKTLFKEIMKTQIESGLPYIFFKDIANEKNPNKHRGYIPQGNLCMESFSNVKAGEESHTCNLISINMARVQSRERLATLAGLCTRMLDNTIELTTTPIDSSNTHNKLYRTIGVGALGLADYFAINSIPYEKAQKEADELFEIICYYSIQESIKLSAQRGPFEAFDGSQWDTGEMIRRYEEQSALGLDWTSLQCDIDVYGIRNSQLMAIAPNTSSSLIQGCTASVLPPYDLKFYDSAKKGALPVVVPYLSKAQWYYKPYKYCEHSKVIDVIASISKWVDSGVSFELIFDLNDPKINAKYIFDTIMYIWKTRQIKSIYYVRFIQKDATKLKEKNECVSCAG